MFSLNQQVATLSHLNPRIEIHGEEPTGAVDLKITFTESSGLLSEFHPRLRYGLYKADQTPDLAGDNDAPTIRIYADLIERLRLKHELKGAAVAIGFGLGGASDIALDPADVDGFSVELLEGGSCNYTFRVKCHPSGGQLQKLYEVLGREITISVTPAAEKQGSLGLPIEE